MTVVIVCAKLIVLSHVCEQVVNRRSRLSFTFISLEGLRLKVENLEQKSRDKKFYFLILFIRANNAGQSMAQFSCVYFEVASGKKFAADEAKNRESIAEIKCKQRIMNCKYRRDL